MSKARRIEKFLDRWSEGFGVVGVVCLVFAVTGYKPVWQDACILIGIGVVLVFISASFAVCADEQEAKTPEQPKS